MSGLDGVDLISFRPQWARCYMAEAMLDTPVPASVCVPKSALFAQPNSQACIDSQLLMGEPVLILAKDEKWAWVKSQWDGYQGYCAIDDLSNSDLNEQAPPTHRVFVPSTFLYSEPDLKAPMLGELSIGCEVSVAQIIETENGQYARLANGGGVFLDHLIKADQRLLDWVGTARNMLGRPYLWAGRTGSGLDCSALVQLSLHMAGIFAPRDSDMQAALLGEELSLDTPLTNLKRGDLIFWPGHVGIVESDGQLIHANARTMDVACEDLVSAIDRLAELYSQPSAYKRILV